MKLKPVTVSIRGGENGYLNAYVVMDGHLGSNLLEGRQITIPDEALKVAAQVLAADNIEIGAWQVNIAPSHPATRALP